jgi:hypothetical protein
LSIYEGLGTYLTESAMEQTLSGCKIALCAAVWATFDSPTDTPVGIKVLSMTDFPVNFSYQAHAAV